MYSTINLMDEGIMELLALYANEIKKVEITPEAILLVMSGQNSQMMLGADLREHDMFNTTFSMSTDYTHLTLRSL